MTKYSGKPKSVIDEQTRFLESGKAAIAEANPLKEEKAAKAPKRKKLVELPEEVFVALKDRAHEDFKRTGKTVTETEIIITALKNHLGLV